MYRPFNQPATPTCVHLVEFVSSEKIEDTLLKEVLQINGCSTNWSMEWVLEVVHKGDLAMYSFINLKYMWCIKQFLASGLQL